MTKRKRKLRIRIAILIGCILFFLSLGLIFGLADYVMKVKRQTLEEAFKWQKDHYDVSFYETLRKKNYEVRSEDGYILHVQLLYHPEPSDKYIILSHGHTDNRMGALKYVPMYMRQGFNCIIYDLRAHGENEPDFVTYGVREGMDLNCLIEDTRNRYPNLTKLGLHGESLGAATTVTCMKYHPKVDFAVADCGFADIENVLRGVLKRSKMPSFLVDLADLGGKLRYGYSLKKMRPIDSLAENTVPFLFIHGEDDDFISPENSRRMAEATRGESRMILIPGAGHAGSVFADPKTYEKEVASFLAGV